MYTILQAIPVLVTAALLGNWFLSEVKQAKAARKPWYAPYLTPPGLLILFAILIPLIYLGFSQ
jgi:hypothetical protein